MSMLLVTKDNLGVVLLLLLVVFLSQSKLLSFFAESKLGRGFILIFIIFITFCNKSLGIVAVLLVIIVFTYLSSGGLEIFKEGLTNSSISEKNEKHNKKHDKVAKEGFDIYGLEDSMKRGKMSNELPSYNKGEKVDIDNLASFNEVYTSMYSSI